MCRIVGFIDDSTNLNKRQLLMEMRDTMEYGGPDARGIYVEDNLALGHRRLAVLDTSDAGKQPMIWKEYVIVYNGEIYNFKEIRQELQSFGIVCESDTDTEVILKAFEKWGMDCVEKFRGMFAFALWDRQTKKLLLCRDRVGVKPLYWYHKDGLFMFASELKAFHKHPAFDKEINQEAVSLFLQQGYIQSPYCIFKHAKKLKPGHFLSIDSQGQIELFPYWEVDKIYENGQVNRQSEGAIKEKLTDLLKESFKYRMVSDVPVGIFLSGGIDSSLVTSLLQKESNTQLKTFTIGFENETINEANYAKEIAEYIGTDHTELYCTADMFQSTLERQADFYDEPFGDEASIPTFLVAALAKNQVTVCLSADGGDELFGGYTKYEFTAKYYPKIAKIPKSLRQVCAKGLNRIDANWLEKNKRHLPILNKYSDLGSKIPKFRNALLSEDIKECFSNASTAISANRLKKMLREVQVRLGTYPPIQPDRLIAYLGMLDISTYLEGGIMTKVDRATMQTAIEGREPMLDHHLIEYALQLPDGLKMKNGQLKYLLKDILHDYVPPRLIDRPKHGFVVPIYDWLHTFLKEDLEEMLNDTTFFTTFRLHQPTIKIAATQFFKNSGNKVSTKFIWFLLMLYRWKRRWL